MKTAMTDTQLLDWLDQSRVLIKLDSVGIRGVICSNTGWLRAAIENAIENKIQNQNQLTPPGIDAAELNYVL